MIIYQAQKSTFLHDLHHRDIEEVILEAYLALPGPQKRGAREVIWAFTKAAQAD